jgi:hypothetical protein
MAENENDQQGSIDYAKSQADIDKAKQKAHDADKQRLAEESGLTESD